MEGFSLISAQGSHGDAGGVLLPVGVAWALQGCPSLAADLAAQGTGIPVEAAASQDSLEVRWMFQGPLTAAMRDWFARFTAKIEVRDDIYLLQPRPPGLSVKLRDGSRLEAKAFLGSPGTIDVPGGSGRLELWRKWAFYGDAAPRTSTPSVARWEVVRKERISALFSLDVDGGPAGAGQLTGTGCAAELTEIGIDGDAWVSVGFEASGSPELLRDALAHAVGLVFGVEPPAAMAFGMANSQSYGQWLDRWSADHC